VSLLPALLRSATCQSLGLVVAPHHDRPVITGTANASATRATGVPK